MEVITHTLASVALTRAGLNRVTPLALPMAIAAGLLADVDLASRWAGAEAYLRWRRTATHSLAGTAAIAIVVAAAFWLLRRKNAAAPVRFLCALAATCTGAGTHLLLDLLGTHGVQLLWPFRRSWQAWDLVEAVDVWVLAFLLAGLLLPELFRMVSEEIGARSGPGNRRRGALAALVLVSAYCGVRALLHQRANELLRSTLYNGAAPLTVAAFPSPAWPFTWRGVAETEDTLEEAEVSAGFTAGDIAPSTTHFKPEPSAMLEAAQNTATAQRFLQFARFPLASVLRLREGYQVELRDLRFAGAAEWRPAPVARIELDENLRVTDERLLLRTSP